MLQRKGESCPMWSTGKAAISQQDREFTSAYPDTRTTDETFSKPRAGAMFPLHFEPINTAFRLSRHPISASLYRQRLKQAFHLWHKAAFATVHP
jgi:hypothetical protein